MPGADRAGVRRDRPGPGREDGHPGAGRRDRRRAAPRSRPGCGRPATWGRRPSSCWPRTGGPRRRRWTVAEVVTHAARDRRGRGAGLAGPQAGPAGRAAGPGHPAGGPLPAPAGHREPAAGHRHAHHPGRAGPGARRRPGRPAGAGAGLQHLLRPRQGGRDAGRRRAGRGGADPRSSPATRCGSCWPSGWPRPTEILAQLGGQCSAEYKYDGVRVQAHRTADGEIELFTRRLETDQRPVPRRGRDCWPPGWARARRSSRARWWRTTPTRASCGRSARSCCGGASTASTEAVRDVPVGLFCFDLLYADGEDLTRLPYPRAAGPAGRRRSPPRPGCG